VPVEILRSLAPEDDNWREQAPLGRYRHCGLALQWRTYRTAAAVSSDPMINNLPVKTLKHGELTLKVTRARCKPGDFPS
jgi:hypothetical protein